MQTWENGESSLGQMQGLYDLVPWFQPQAISGRNNENSKNKQIVDHFHYHSTSDFILFCNSWRISKSLTSHSKCTSSEILYSYN